MSHTMKAAAMMTAPQMPSWNQSTLPRCCGPTPHARIDRLGRTLEVPLVEVALRASSHEEGLDFQELLEPVLAVLAPETGLQ